jgi:hypothetical protein
MFLHYGQVIFAAKPSFFVIVMQNTYSLGIFKYSLNALTFAKLSPAFTFILRVLIQRHTYNYSSINVRYYIKSSRNFRNQLLYGNHC